MAIDLANVKISLAEFQSVSSGKYNAGEVKLSGETSLAKMNNHVHLRMMNVETISHEETLAIKQAFVNALASNGVGTAALNAVRREIGLLPDGKGDRTLPERSIKPLSRQQIRDIIDRNAEAIDAAKGEITVATGPQSGKGVFSSVRGAMRDSTNAALPAAKVSLADDDIAIVKALVGGDVDFMDPEDRALMLRAAIAQKGILEVETGGKPSTSPDGTHRATSYGSGDCRTIPIQLGMSVAEFADKLDNLILRLRYGDEPAAKDREARAEFSALPDSEKSRWLSRLAGNPSANGQKARAVAVMLMQSRGIDDYETLSLVNRLGDAEAIAFAHQISTADPTLAGDAFRHGGIIRSFEDAADTRPVDVPDGSKAFVPDIPPRLYNEKVYAGLAQGSKDLPLAFATMAREVRDEVVAVFGEDAVTKPGTVADSDSFGLVVAGDVAKLIDCESEDAERVTPDSIRDGYRKAAMEQAAGKKLAEFIAGIAFNGSWSICNSEPVTKEFLAVRPDIVETLASCTTKEDVASTLEGLRTDARLQTALTRASLIDGCAYASVGVFRAALAEELDLPPDALVVYGDLDNASIAEKALELARKMHSGEVSASTPEEIQAAFRDMATALAREKADALRSIDALRISPELRTGLRTVVFRMNGTDGLDAGAAIKAARQADFIKVTSLVNGKAEPAAVLEAIAEACGAVDGAATESVVADHGDGLAVGFARQLILQAAIDQAPGCAEALEGFLATAAIQPGSEEGVLADRLRQALLDRKGSQAARIMMVRPMERAFLDGVGAVRATEAGYLQAELPQLARTFALCMAAGMGSEEAMSAVLDPESKPRRLARYGGRFTESVDSFKQGLRLQGWFDEWFAKACASVGREDTHTLHNFSSFMRTPDLAVTVERFLFEEIAANGSIPLDADDPDEIFGVDKNPAMGFIGRVADHGLALAVLHLPPAAREIVYEVFNTVNPPEEGAARLNTSIHAGALVSRTLANCLTLSMLRSAGPLSRDSIVAVLFPEIPGMSAYKNDLLLAELTRVSEIAQTHARLFPGVGEYATPAERTAAQAAKTAAYQSMLTVSGASYPQIASAIDAGLALPPCLTIAKGGNFESAGMVRLGNPVLAEREAMADLLSSPAAPVGRADWKSVIPESGNRFEFRFQDGTVLSTRRGVSKGEADRAIDVIADKIGQVCGSVHQAQLAAVYREISAEGGSKMVNAFADFGILTSERCPLVRSIARDEATGTIYINTTNPEGFPFNFNWMTSIDIFGTVSKSPIFFEPAVPVQQPPAPAPAPAPAAAPEAVA